MHFKINSREEYISEYQKSIENPEEFWAEKATRFKWMRKWDRTLEWNY
jgi:acetyl-CoA synthetase